MADNINMNLPYNFDAEQSVLGCILQKSDCIQDVMIYLKPEYFYLPQHKTIFASMVAMYSNPGAAIDPVIIADALAKSGQYDSAGGRDYLVQLAQAVPSTANVESYAKIVKEQYYLRRLIESAQEIIEEANSGVGDANALIDNAEQKIYDIREGKETNAPTRIGEVIINGVYDKLSKLTGENKDDYKGIPTGFGLLDKYTTGLNKSDFILIGARPAMGKTSFALNLAHNVSMIGKKKTIFFSLEMTKERRAFACLAGRRYFAKIQNR